MKSKFKILPLTILACYAVILFLVLTIYRFPADKLIASTVEELSQGRVMFHSKNMTPAFLARYTFEDVSLVFDLGRIRAGEDLKSLTLGPDYPALLKGSLPIRFKGLFQRGDLRGEGGISMTRGTRDTYLRAEVSGVYLEDLNLLRYLSERNPKGQMKGTIHLAGPIDNLQGIRGEGLFLLKNGSIGTRFDLPGMESVPFESIRLAFSLKDGTVTLKDSQIVGPMFSGNLAGTIRLNKKITRSIPRITVKMTPGPLLEKNELARQFLGKLSAGNLPLVIKVGGTLERPSIVWSKK